MVWWQKINMVKRKMRDEIRIVNRAVAWWRVVEFLIGRGERDRERKRNRKQNYLIILRSFDRGRRFWGRNKLL